MPTLWGSNLQLKALQTSWGTLYEARLANFGSTAVILPMGDPIHGKPDATTFTTVGEEQVTFTWLPSGHTPSALDTPLDLTLPSNYQGIIPIVKFNATDEAISTPDAAYWTRNDAASQAFSVVIWANVTDTAAARMLLAKWDDNLAIQEWRVGITLNDTLQLLVRDDSVPKNVNRTSDAAINQGVWAQWVVTYDGSGGASAMNGAVLYQNGASFASTAANDATYVAMEDGTSLVRVGNNLDGAGAGESFFSGSLAGGPLGIAFVQAVLTADQILRDYNVGRRALGV